MKAMTGRALAVLAAAALLCSCGGNKPARTVTFEILTTNDVHGRWFDTPYVEGEAQRNSLFAIQYYVDSVRTAVGAEHVVLVDAGDCLQGDNAPYYYNYVDTLSPHLFPRLVSYMDYDAVVMGNHDVETGHPVYDRVAREMAAAGVPLLEGNALRTDTGEPYMPYYTMLDRDGVRIAILGFNNANISAWLDETLWSGMAFSSLIPLVQEDVDRVRQKEHPDIVIVAVHSGTGEGDGSNYESQGLDLFRTLKGVDFLVCSHDHRPYIEESAGICLLNSGSHARNVAHGTITLDLDARGQVIGRHLGAGLIPVKADKADMKMRETFRPEFEAVQAFTLREVGRLSEELRTRDAYTGRSLYIDFVHLITLLSGKTAGADLSFAAPLTYNGTVKAGTLIYNDLFTIYPFENQLFVVEMTGKEILDYLEHDYDLWIQSPAEGDALLRIVESDDPRTGAKGWSFVNRSYNFDSAAGIDYTVDVTRPAGSRIAIRGFADGRPFEPEKTYRVAMTSYRANGGGDLLIDGAGIPKEELDSRIVARMPELRELIWQFLQKNPEISPALIRRNERLLGDWKFIPEAEAAKALQRDMERVFPKKN